ncbi:MAG: DUF1624 domain-containing protein [Alphaproteobacteria bacterium]|nr:DUF1624 domain-containing protein [Alphaproteobacteria bacterium]
MASERSKSIDVFRGLTIFLMIVVNTMGAGAQPYPVLVHADWFGFTAADFVFPSFLFAMGCSLVFVLRRPMGNREFLIKTFKRAALLFLLGFLMYWFPFVHLTPDLHWAPNPLGDTRIMGVLQRIALCYLLATLMVRYLSPRQVVAAGIALLGGYWALLVFGAPPGEAFSKAHNIGSLIDRLVLGQSHLWPYDDGFEPEGLLGTLPATVNVAAGYLTFRYLSRAALAPRNLLLLSLTGVVLAVVALGLDPLIPLSKKLWTSSFVLLTVGLDVILLAVLAGGLDLLKLPVPVQFFEILGKNPLVIYLFSELLIPAQALFKPLLGTEPYQWVGIHLFQHLLPGPLGSLLCAVAYTMLCWLFGYVLYERRIFIRL